MGAKVIDTKTTGVKITDPENKRNYGIDLLRITSMFMVVILHVLGQGGILQKVIPDSINYWVAYFIEMACYCAVNCFAIISGYVMYRSKFSFSKLSELWMQLAFYTISITAIFFFLKRDTIDFQSILDAFFPITKGTHWYMTSYFGMYLLTPILNAGIRNINKKHYEITLISCLIIICTLPKILKTSPYDTDKGYSLLWLSLLYILGAYLHKYNIIEKVKKSSAFILYIVCILITWFAKMIFENIPCKTFNLTEYKHALMNYTSPTMVLAGLGLFVIFSKLTFPKGINKAIAFLSPAALGVYIIHTFKPVWDNIIEDFAVDFANKHTIVMVALVLLSAVIIYSVCTAIDLLRIQLFRLCKVKKLCQKIESLAEKVYNKTFTKLFN